MRVNTIKTVVERMDDAIKATGKAVESIELDTEERHALYKSGSTRFRKARSFMKPAHRGTFLTLSGKWIEVLAEEEC